MPNNGMTPHTSGTFLTKVSQCPPLFEIPGLLLLKITLLTGMYFWLVN